MFKFRVRNTSDMVRRLNGDLSCPPSIYTLTPSMTHRALTRDFISTLTLPVDLMLQHFEKWRRK